jgi:hypothetical protein
MNLGCSTHAGSRVSQRRYQANNLLLTALVPGPHELSGDELQNVLKLDVDDKIMLYKEGIVVNTPLFPAGL